MEELRSQIAELQQQMAALHPVAPPPAAAEENVDVNPFTPLQPAQIAAPHRANAVVNDRRWELGIKVDL